MGKIQNWRQENEGKEGVAVGKATIVGVKN